MSFAIVGKCTVKRKKNGKKILESTEYVAWSYEMMIIENSRSGPVWWHFKQTDINLAWS